MPLFKLAVQAATEAELNQRIIEAAAEIVQRQVEAAHELNQPQLESQEFVDINAHLRKMESKQKELVKFYLAEARLIGLCGAIVQP